MKLTKKSKFNLSDGEEDEGFEFEGLGALSERDDFEDEMFPDDDDHYGDATESM
jgi:nucleolar protein 14